MTSPSTMQQPILRKIPTAAERTGRPDRRPLPRWAAPVIAAVILAAMAASVLYGVILSLTSDREQTLAEQVRQACTSGGDAAMELRTLGACAQAALVQAEPAPGPIGAPGADSTVPGPPGLDGQNGADSTVPGPAGPPGQDSTVPGPPGQDGQNGQNGADSTVPGPAGPPGQDGADSTVPGPAGAPGRPPAGFSFVDGDGVQQSCTRDPGSPDDAATYTCTAAPDGPADNQPSVTTLTLLR